MTRNERYQHENRENCEPEIQCKDHSCDDDTVSGSLDEISGEPEMALEDCHEMTQGMLDVLVIRLDAANESKVGTHLELLWRCELYVQLLSTKKGGILILMKPL